MVDEHVATCTFAVQLSSRNALLGTIESAEWACNVRLMTRRGRRKVWTTAEKRMLLARQVIVFQSWFSVGLWVALAKLFTGGVGNILYSGPDAAPLARAAKKLEIRSDLYNLSQNCILSLSLLHTEALCLCWLVPFFQCTAISHAGGKLS